MKKILALALALLTLFSLVACGGSSSGGGAGLGADNAQGGQNGDGINGADTQAPETEEVAIRDTKGEALPAKLTLTKLDTKNYSSILVYDGGYLYGKDGKIGISSFDGKTDTGAKYNFATGEEQFFIVSERSDKAVPTNLATLNAYGLVDVTGRELIPAKYASISVLSSRYAKVCEVTAQRNGSDGALVRLSKSNSTDGAEHYYDGTWYVYDLTTGTKVAGVQGSKPTVPRIRGNIISYTDDAQKNVAVNERGQSIPESADILSNGTYALDGKIYDSVGGVLFTLKRDGYEPYTVADGIDMYVASKYADGKASYAVMDKTGKVVSAVFNDNIYVTGNIIECDDKLYNFKGEQVIDGKFDSVDYLSKAGIELYLLEQDETLTVLDGSFKKIYTGKLDDDMRVHSSYGTVSKTADKKTNVLCYATGDWSIEANVCGFLLAYNGKTPDYKLIDMISGETLVSGVRNIAVSVCNDEVFIITKTQSGYDFYTLAK